jgi:two-component system, NtrC family, response regulator AtoC
VIDFSKIKDRRVLIVEDHEGLAEVLTDEIRDAGLQACFAKSAEEADPLIERRSPDVIVSDLRLPGASGLDLLKHTRTLPHPPSFLLITAFGTVPQAVEALKAGADDFLTKPLDLDHFMHRLARILETRRLREEVEQFRQTLDRGETFHGMFGSSRPMQRLFGQIRQMASSGGPVLIMGESGVGKEMVAQAIHRSSDRKDGPLLAVNCAGIPEALMESELFGHKAGAFTGAQKERKGLFCEAQGGTLLLDEIAEMPLSMQSKLLRILQDGKLRPVGGNREEQVDVRILAATHRDLETAVHEGRFREDLFYRLETFTLQIPPLREREEDIDLLAARFLASYSTQTGKKIEGFSEDAIDLLHRHTFPGNVRELQNAVERAVVFCNSRHIRPEHLPARIRSGKTSLLDRNASPSALFSGNPTLADVEQRYIHFVLEQVNGNKKRAADILGITRKTLYRRIEMK